MILHFILVRFQKHCSYAGGKSCSDHGPYNEKYNQGLNLDHYNCSDGSIMRFHQINNKSWFNSVLNIDRLTNIVTKGILTSSHVYSYNIVIKEVTRNINVPTVRKFVCRYIFPRMKFASLSKGFQEPADRVFDKPNNKFYIILQELKWISGYSSVENTIYWNYYKSEVEGVI